MPKLAICKIHMIGIPALILGIGRTFVEGDEHWTKYQLFTMEDCLDVKYTYTPPTPETFSYSIYKSQEEADAAAAHEREFAASFAKFHGPEVYFENLGKSVPVTISPHDFDFGQAQQIEVTVDELKLLNKDLGTAHWQEFDWETWSK